MNYWSPWLWQNTFQHITYPKLDYGDWTPSLWKKTFHHVTFSQLNYGDQWSLNFNYSQTEGLSYEEQRRGWMVYEHWAFGSFYCSCSWEWSSVNVEVLFRYRRQRQSRRGTVIMRPCEQQCLHCGTFVFPGFSGREVENTLEDLAQEIRMNCYAGPLMKTFDSVVACPGYARAQHKVRFVLTNLAVSDQEWWQIERDTVGQLQNPLWSAYRKNRITSSYFGLVLAAYERQSYPPSLFKTLCEQYNLSGVEAVQYGIRNEPVAKWQYTERTGLMIQERGVFLSASGLLGASPDGTVSGGDRIVEVKCPWTAREMTVRQAAAVIRDFCLQVDKVTGALTLKQHHNYWHQIQGTLHLSGASSCDLVIWTPRNLVILRVLKDPTWAVNIHTLEIFYEYVFLPHVLSQIRRVG